MFLRLARARSTTRLSCEQLSCRRLGARLFSSAPAGSTEEHAPTDLFDPTPEHAALRAMVRSFVTAEVEPQVQTGAPIIVTWAHSLLRVVRRRPSSTTVPSSSTWLCSERRENLAFLA